MTTVPVPDWLWKRHGPSSLAPSQPAAGKRGAPLFRDDSRTRRVFPRPVPRGFRAARKPSGHPGRSAGSSEAWQRSLRHTADGEATTGPSRPPQGGDVLLRGSSRETVSCGRNPAGGSSALTRHVPSVSRSPSVRRQKLLSPLASRPLRSGRWPFLPERPRRARAGGPEMAADTMSIHSGKSFLNLP